MENITKMIEKAQGVEVLCFEEAEIKKVKGFATVFAAAGPLSVLYFKDYNRYVLQLNDWKYPLLRRLPIIASEKKELTSASYTLPSLNGFSFTLDITSLHNSPSLSNFETILTNNSHFCLRGESQPQRKLEASPDDKLARFVKVEPTTKQVIAETIDDTVEKVKEVAGNIKSDIKNITSTNTKTKKRVDFKELKTKNFRKSAHPSIKKSFVKSSDKSTREFLKMRRENPILNQTQDYENMQKLDKSSLPSVWINKGDLEESILNNKDLAVKGNFFQPITRPPMDKGLVDIIGEALHDIKGYIVGTEVSSVANSRTGQGPMAAHSRSVGNRILNPATDAVNKLATGVESMLHYQG